MKQKLAKLIDFSSSFETVRTTVAFVAAGTKAITNVVVVINFETTLATNLFAWCSEWPFREHNSVTFIASGTVHANEIVARLIARVVVFLVEPYLDLAYAAQGECSTLWSTALHADMFYLPITLVPLLYDVSFCA